MKLLITLTKQTTIGHELYDSITNYRLVFSDSVLRMYARHDFGGQFEQGIHIGENLGNLTRIHRIKWLSISW